MVAIAKNLETVDIQELSRVSRAVGNSFRNSWGVFRSMLDAHRMLLSDPGGLRVTAQTLKNAPSLRGIASTGSDQSQNALISFNSVWTYVRMNATVVEKLLPLPSCSSELSSL
ncbi:hypothetical protein L0Z66_19265 (plasmid) [Phaeobacter sp. BS34]|uniref:hypothetical protein n=1 Tax=Phaeobacter TaxID=302485 RepID=UPI00191C402F|nr:hypothetical protein [Phaeobacter inhibens]